MSDYDIFEPPTFHKKQEKEALKKAAALKYDPTSDAVPVVAAIGIGSVAEKIIEKANENDVPVVEDSSTADILSQLSVGDSIPPALYEAVAQILVFISDLDRNLKEKYSNLRQ